MYEKVVFVKDPSIFRAQDSQSISNMAKFYKSTLLIGYEEKLVNAKSMLGVLSLGITHGTMVTVSGEGPDEEAAVEALCQVLTDGHK